MFGIERNAFSLTVIPKNTLSLGGILMAVVVVYDCPGISQVSHTLDGGGIVN